jgi:hypothetical protein
VHRPRSPSRSVEATTTPRHARLPKAQKERPRAFRSFSGMFFIERDAPFHVEHKRRMNWRDRCPMDLVVGSIRLFRLLRQASSSDFSVCRKRCVRGTRARVADLRSMRAPFVATKRIARIATPSQQIHRIGSESFGNVGTL